MKYDQPSVSGFPGPEPSSSSSHRTPSVVARVIQNQPNEVASWIPRTESESTRHRRRIERMLSISRSIHASHEGSWKRASSAICWHLDT